MKEEYGDEEDTFDYNVKVQNKKVLKSKDRLYLKTYMPRDNGKGKRLVKRPFKLFKEDQLPVNYERAFPNMKNLAQENDYLSTEEQVSKAKINMIGQQRATVELLRSPAQIQRTFVISDLASCGIYWKNLCVLCEITEEEPFGLLYQQYLKSHLNSIFPNKCHKIDDLLEKKTQYFHQNWHVLENLIDVPTLSPEAQELVVGMKTWKMIFRQVNMIYSDFKKPRAMTYLSYFLTVRGFLKGDPEITLLPDQNYNCVREVQQRVECLEQFEKQRQETVLKELNQLTNKYDKKIVDSLMQDLKQAFNIVPSDQQSSESSSQNFSKNTSIQQNMRDYSYMGGEQFESFKNSVVEDGSSYNLKQ